MELKKANVRVDKKVKKPTAIRDNVTEWKCVYDDGLEKRTKCVCKYEGLYAKMLLRFSPCAITTTI